MPVWKVDQLIGPVVQKAGLQLRQMRQPAAPLMAAACWELQAEALLQPAPGFPLEAGRVAALHPGRCLRSRDLWRYRLVMLRFHA